MYWQEHKILLFADVHFGKAAHFRKAGIAIPEQIHQSDLDRIKYLTRLYNPQRIIFLGDLFHSAYNNTWQTFENFWKKEIDIVPELILGNHDILDATHYSFLQLHHGNLIIDPFILSHYPLETTELSGYYNLCGHIHPSIRITGRAKQSLRVECFYFSKNHGILPAFGNFTGSFNMPVKSSDDKIFAVTNQKILQLF